MAAIAYSVGGVPTRKPAPDNSRRRRQRGNHLRLVEAPLFDEPIFEELKEESEALSAEWSVWRRPMPMIPRPQIITNYVPAEMPASFLAPLALPTKRAVPSINYQRERVVHESSRALAINAPRYRLRRLVACIALGFAIFGGLSGASALAGSHQGSPAVISGSVQIPGGYEYTVQPGDTLWSIASRVYPNGDPRALVTQLESQLRGATPTPGVHLRLP